MEMIFAYIDPFTGSLLLQVLAAGIMSALIFFKKSQAFVLGLFRIKSKRNDVEETENIPSIKLHESNTEEKNAA